MTEITFSFPNISLAWAKVFLDLARSPPYERSPVVVNVDLPIPGTIGEESSIRRILDSALAANSESTVETVASTIFPNSMWNPNLARAQLYERYLRVWPRIRKCRSNHNGTYFHRMIAFQGRQGQVVNQLEHVIATRESGNHRRSALQLAIFDPSEDHTNQRQRGFPCLQQVALVPGEDESLRLTAFYAAQTFFEKAYGNFLGLSRLGFFISREMGLRFAGITVVASLALLSQGLKSEPRKKIIADLRGVPGL